MSQKICISHAKLNGSPFGPSFVEAVRSARLSEDEQHVCVDREVLERLIAEHKKPADWPALSDMVGNFYASITRWVDGGFKVVDKPRFDDRLTTCKACPQWSTTAGIGRCRACGCTGLKLWLANERCPKGLWS